MESVLGRVLMMVAVGVVGGALAIMLVRAESRYRVESPDSGTDALDPENLLASNLTRSNDLEETLHESGVEVVLKRDFGEDDRGNVNANELPKSDIIDGILSVLRRKLLSYPLEADEALEKGEEEDASRHRVRHFGRKTHHRRYDEANPMSREVVLSLHPREESSAATFTHASNATNHANNTINSPSNTNSHISNTSSLNGGSVPREEGGAGQSYKTGQSTRPKFFDEVRDAVLLALPLSLLLTLLLVICGACCCCRYRARLDQDQDPLTRHGDADEDVDDDIREWTPLCLGLCDACLPDISYQVHLAKKTRPSKKRRHENPVGLTLEHPEVALGQEGVKCHPPLYKLLSNLPPGDNLLEEDNAMHPETPMLRRSQSLEHLPV